MVQDILAELRMWQDHTTNKYARERIIKAIAEIERLRVIVQGWEHSARNAERDIAELRAERDEARREVCEYEAGEIRHRHDINAAYMAALRGWDCFKEDGNE